MDWLARVGYARVVNTELFWPQFVNAGEEVSDSGRLGPEPVIHPREPRSTETQ